MNCDYCGTKIINDCLRCGAPQCCPKCCAETTAQLQRDFAARQYKDVDSYDDVTRSYEQGKLL